MPAPILSSEPPRRVVVRFWLASLGLGAALVVGYRLLSQETVAIAFCTGLANGVVAAGLSLPALLLWHKLLPWVLRPAPQHLRWQRLLAAQGASCTLTAALTYLLFGRVVNQPDGVLLLLTGGYAAAGLAAAAWFFRPWLQPTRQPA